MSDMVAVAYSTSYLFIFMPVDRIDKKYYIKSRGKHGEI